MTEDQEYEGQEAFEDYEGSRITFNPDAAKQLEETKKVSWKETLEEMYEFWGIECSSLFMSLKITNKS
jgi:hypothetical protein